MLKQPTLPVITALASLEGNQNFEIVLDWLRSSREALREKNDVMADEMHFRQTQGAIQAVNDVVAGAETARRTLNSIKEKEQAKRLAQISTR